MVTTECCSTRGCHARVRINYRSPRMLLWMTRRMLTMADENGVSRWHPLLWLSILRALWFMVRR